MCWGVGELSNVGKYGEVWKSVWGECGGCGEVGQSVLGCGKV